MKRVFVALLAFILFFALSAKAQIIDETPQDGLYRDNGIVDTKPIPLPTIRKADIMWKKRIWREIDFRQKMNQMFYFPINQQQNWKSFITVVLDAMKEGNITAYDISSTDELLIPVSYNEIIARQTDTIHLLMQRSYPPYDEYDTTIFTEFDPSTVMRLRVKEDWYFDKQRSQMMVRIEALCPVMVKQVNGEERVTPLFWISYPESRGVLAKALAFNPDNPAMRLTYDEVFIKRLFESYIYKEENVYDRRISQYATGLDAMLESERIQKEMFNYEQFLWEY